MEKYRATFFYMNMVLFSLLLSYSEPNSASAGPPSPSPPEGMALIPAGEFLMGEPGAHKKANVDAFFMDKYEVTQKEFERVMGKNRSRFKGENRPVEKVTWYKAEIYCRRVGKRLPTEAEWEKAAKGGKNTLYPWGHAMERGKANFCDANCEGNVEANPLDDGFKYTAPVGSFPPNPYGLYDMAGNVSEWVADSYGRRKSLRGGAWKSPGYFVRPSHRISVAPYRNFPFAGFRCAKQ